MGIRLFEKKQRIQPTSVHIYVRTLETSLAGFGTTLCTAGALLLLLVLVGVGGASGTTRSMIFMARDDDGEDERVHENGEETESTGWKCRGCLFVAPHFTWQNQHGVQVMSVKSVNDTMLQPSQQWVPQRTTGQHSPVSKLHNNSRFIHSHISVWYRH